MNIFSFQKTTIFNPHKTKKLDCRYPESMNSFIISSLKKERSTLKYQIIISIK